MVDFGEVSGEDEPGVAAQPGYESEDSLDAGKDDLDIVSLPFWTSILSLPSSLGAAPSSSCILTLLAHPHRTTSSSAVLHFHLVSIQSSVLLLSDADSGLRRREVPTRAIALAGVGVRRRSCSDTTLDLPHLVDVVRLEVPQPARAFRPFGFCPSDAIALSAGQSPAFPSAAFPRRPASRCLCSPQSPRSRTISVIENNLLRSCRAFVQAFLPPD